MESSDVSTFSSTCEQTTGISMSSWCVPFGGLQSNFIVWKYRQVFPGQVLADRIKIWPTALAKSLHKDFESIDMKQVRTAAAQHEEERQAILNEMKNLILQEKLLLSLDPLTNLEIYEDMKYRGFQFDMKNKYSHIRKYFPWLLPKRKYKPKKKSAAKIKRRNQKKKLLKKLQKSKVPLETSSLDLLDSTSLSLGTTWDPLQPKFVEPPVTYSTSGCASKDYHRKAK